MTRGARSLLVGALVCACAQRPGAAQGPEVIAPGPVGSAASMSADRDGDGFADGQDGCPEDPGLAPDGCPPPPDTDGDGILDADDKCPLEPERLNGYEDEDGCPDVIPKSMTDCWGLGGLASARFDSGKHVLTARTRQVLDRAVAIMKEYPHLQLELSGHTDEREKSAAGLSLRRVQAVQRYLLEQGVEAARLVVRGAGADEQVDTNTTEAGRARNRRVEFTLIEP